MRTEAIEQVEELKRAFAATGSERVTTHIANINYLFALLDEEKAALAAAEQRVAELESERDAAIDDADRLADTLELVQNLHGFRSYSVDAVLAAHSAAGTGKDG